MGKGATSPTRIDLSGYQNLCAAARNTGVRRLIYVSFKGVSQDAPVDIFRIKWYIEDAIRRSGVPHVMLRPTAFMDIWIDQLLAKGIREKGVATIFGDGNTIANYIAVDDVAQFAEKILSRPEVVNEAVETGGPSNVSQNDLAALLERRLKSSGKRCHVPVVMMRLLPPVIRPFNEVTARLMTLGLYLGNDVDAIPRVEGVRRSVWRDAANRRNVHRSDGPYSSLAVHCSELDVGVKRQPSSHLLGKSSLAQPAPAQDHKAPDSSLDAPHASSLTGARCRSVATQLRGFRLEPEDPPASTMICEMLRAC